MNEQLPFFQILEGIHALEGARAPRTGPFGFGEENSFPENDRIVPEEFGTFSEGRKKSEKSLLIGRVTQARLYALCFAELEELLPGPIRGKAEQHLVLLSHPRLQGRAHLQPGPVHGAGIGKDFLEGVQLMLAHIDAGLLHSHHKGLRIDSCAALHGSRVTAAQTERRRLLGGGVFRGKFFRGIVPGLFQHLAGIVLPVAEEETSLREPVFQERGVFVHHARHERSARFTQGLSAGIGHVFRDFAFPEELLKALLCHVEALCIAQIGSRRNNGQRIRILHRTLAFRIENSQPVDRVAKELQTQRPRIPRGENIENITSAGDFAGVGHHGYADKSPLNELIKEQILRPVSSLRYLESVIQKEIPGWVPDKERAGARNNDAGSTQGKRVERRQA